ncbi:hypothetical protein L6164_026510 [Bauhinia variegata]|uniref:Uncharacterized protein n=1 Tax=Bauhinia variegata TaxID=167791 RepID=A0ACB9LQY1_BAUVA|nr:hypothetical protein L6164_026510 [Bauhinia variegata]
MASSLDKCILLFSLLLMIVSTTGFKSDESHSQAKEVLGIFDRTVEIINSLEGAIDLTVHCKSKDDDLGFHTLQPGQSYQFHFRPELFATTLYFCSFAWPGDPSLHKYDVYDQKRDFCHFCSWQIHKTNLCRFKEGSGYTDCYPYNKSLKKEGNE